MSPLSIVYHTFRVMLRPLALCAIIAVFVAALPDGADAAGRGLRENAPVVAAAGDARGTSVSGSPAAPARPSPVTTTTRTFEPDKLPPSAFGDADDVRG